VNIALFTPRSLQQGVLTTGVAHEQGVVAVTKFVMLDEVVPYPLRLWRD
jgi:hypothetical protein